VLSLICEWLRGVWEFTFFIQGNGMGYAAGCERDDLITVQWQ